MGFMGTGKSSVGRIVANRLHYKYLDTDHLIEEKYGKTISQIFQESGEKVFREMERLTTLGLEDLKETVIAIGGGLILDPTNLESLRKHALLVCLWASPQSIYSRIRSQEHRPLLQKGNPLETIRTLLSERAPLYRKSADVLINTEFRSLPEVARHVAHSFLSGRLQRSPKPESPRA